MFHSWLCGHWIHGSAFTAASTLTNEHGSLIGCWQAHMQLPHCIHHPSHRLHTVLLSSATSLSTSATVHCLCFICIHLGILHPVPLYNKINMCPCYSSCYGVVKPTALLEHDPGPTECRHVWPVSTARHSSASDGQARPG